MRTKKSKKAAYETLDKFLKIMEEKGFSPLFFEDEWQPHVIAVKRNHYRIEARVFISPDFDREDDSLSVSAKIGTDVHTVMYFQLKNINSPDAFERFEKLMNEAGKYIEEEVIKPEEDRREF